MEEYQVVEVLAALAHESRLRVFRLLARQGSAGLAAGKIAEELAIPPATLSFHLRELVHAGLITDRREGRSILYALHIEATKQLFDFLLSDCCQGRPDLCGPAGCTPPRKKPVPLRLPGKQ